MRRFITWSFRAFFVLISLSAICVSAYFCLGREKLSTGKLPRPNSGTLTTAEATRQLPGCLARSKGIPFQHDLIQQWKNPTHGFRVHVHRDGTVQTIDFEGEQQVGLAALDACLDSTKMWLGGVTACVLMSSDTDEWDTPKKTGIGSTIRKPTIQIYIIVGKITMRLD